MLCGQFFSSCDLVETHLLDSDEKGRPRRTRRPSEGTQKCPGANYQGNVGRRHSEKGWNTVWMEAEDQAVSFWSKCYVLKNLRAKIGKKKKSEKEREMVTNGRCSLDTVLNF